MRKYNKKRGFTLPEVLISLSVLAMVVVSATELVVSNIRTNSDNMDTILAYGLAQEGLEAVRNIRDSNWLLGADYSKGGFVNRKAVWGASLPTSGAGYYLIDYGFPEVPGSTYGIADSSVAPEDAPWKLIVAPSGVNETNLQDFDQTALLKAKQNGNDVRYFTSGQGMGGAITPFYRLIKIENISHTVPADSGLAAAGRTIDGKEYRVTSIVAWKQGQLVRNVTLTTDLTDWKEGAI